MASDVTDARRKSDHLRLVINELNHRVRNNLAMVQSIAMQTFRKADDTEQAATRFTERLVALARANDLLTGERWAGVDLRGVECFRPDHRAGTRQRGIGGRHRTQAEVRGQTLALCLERLDHQQVLGRMPGAAQAANDGAGHVAATDECDAGTHGPAV